MDKINKLQEILKNMADRIEQKRIEIEEKEILEDLIEIHDGVYAYRLRIEPTIKFVNGNSTNLNSTNLNDGWGQIKYSFGTTLGVDLSDLEGK